MLQMPKKHPTRGNKRPSTSPYARAVAGPSGLGTSPTPPDPNRAVAGPSGLGTSPTLPDPNGDQMPAWATTLLSSIDQRIGLVESALAEQQSVQHCAPSAVQAATAVETTAFTGASPPSTSLPILERVPMTVKNKIWAGEFVEMERLVQDVREETVEALSFQLDSSSPTPTLKLVNNRNRPAKTLSLYQWIMAWNRYMSVTNAQSPQHAQGLSLHMENVLQLADKKADWRRYDTEFRKLVAAGRQSWDNTNMEVYIRAYMERTDTARTPSSTRLQVPRGCCQRFHTTGKCDAGMSCRFQHKCFSCGRLHPAKDCRSPHGSPPQILQGFRPDQPFRTGARQTKQGDRFSRTGQANQ